MHEQATEQKNNYFRELTLNLRHEGSMFASHGRSIGPFFIFMGKETKNG